MFFEPVGKIKLIPETQLQCQMFERKIGVLQILSRKEGTLFLLIRPWSSPPVAPEYPQNLRRRTPDHSDQFLQRNRPMHIRIEMIAQSPPGFRAIVPPPRVRFHPLMQSKENSVQCQNRFAARRSPGNPQRLVQLPELRLQRTIRKKMPPPQLIRIAERIRNPSAEVHPDFFPRIGGMRTVFMRNMRLNEIHIPPRDIIRLPAATQPPATGSDEFKHVNIVLLIARNPIPGIAERRPGHEEIYRTALGQIRPQQKTLLKSPG